MLMCGFCFFFFKQKTAYEMRISDWSSVVCSSDLQSGEIRPVVTTPAPAGNEKTFLGHPRGLYMLFFAEMWERFSYYGMRALLVLYLTKHWLFSDGDASMVYGAYTALVLIGRANV